MIAPSNEEDPLHTTCPKCHSTIPRDPPPDYPSVRRMANYQRDRATKLEGLVQELSDGLKAAMALVNDEEGQPGRKWMRDKAKVLLEQVPEGPSAMEVLAKKLLWACENYHKALDLALAMLVEITSKEGYEGELFLPSKSRMWPAVERGHKLIERAKHTLGTV